MGQLVGRLAKKPRPAEARDFEGLGETLVSIFREIARRSPEARVVAVTYPAILPECETCPLLQIDAADVAMMREVGERLAEVTQTAARNCGAMVVDMARLSVGHDACSAFPWVFGARPAKGAAFHPTLEGAKATAEHIRQALALERVAD